MKYKRLYGGYSIDCITYENNDSIIEWVFTMRRELSNIPIIDRFIDFCIKKGL